jgi:hypothetical protein
MLTGCASDRGQVRIMRHDQERGPVGIVNLPRKGARPTAAARHWRAWNWRRLDRGKVATIKDIAAAEGVTNAFRQPLAELAYLGPEGKEPGLGH